MTITETGNSKSIETEEAGSRIVLIKKQLVY